MNGRDSEDGGVKDVRKVSIRFSSWPKKILVAKKQIFYPLRPDEERRSGRGKLQRAATVSYDTSSEQLKRKKSTKVAEKEQKLLRNKWQKNFWEINDKNTQAREQKVTAPTCEICYGEYVEV